MNEILAIGSIDQLSAATQAGSTIEIRPLNAAGANALASTELSVGSFSKIISDGLARMDAKVAHADQMVTQFVIDDNTPIHQVTMALEEARLSVELAMQVRQRLVEGYRELMNMQL